MVKKGAIEPAYNLPKMKSVERISKLPAVEQTVDLASNLYTKAKGTSHLAKVVLTTAESTVKVAVDMSLPVTSILQGPIGVVDSLLCSSLDFVETKIPAVKLPLDEMYKNTRDTLYVIPGVKCACEAGEHGMKKAVEIAFGASQYGTQKLKEVKDTLTQPQSSNGNLHQPPNTSRMDASERKTSTVTRGDVVAYLSDGEKENYLPNHAKSE